MGHRKILGQLFLQLVIAFLVLLVLLVLHRPRGEILFLDKPRCRMSSRKAVYHYDALGCE
jgi:hypothetical protein